jgi:hypothetical protein
MKATPQLIQYALGAVGIGIDMEMSMKVLATVRLLEDKGDQADLSDLAKIAAIQVEDTVKGKMSKIDLSRLEANDRIKLKNGDTYLVSEINCLMGEYQLICYFGDIANYLGWFSIEGYCKALINESINDVCSNCDIIEIIKPTKP